MLLIVSILKEQKNVQIVIIKINLDPFLPIITQAILHNVGPVMAIAAAVAVVMGSVAIALAPEADARVQQ